MDNLLLDPKYASLVSAVVYAKPKYNDQGMFNVTDIARVSKLSPELVSVFAQNFEVIRSSGVDPEEAGGLMCTGSMTGCRTRGSCPAFTETGGRCSGVGWIWAVSRTRRSRQSRPINERASLHRMAGERDGTCAGEEEARAKTEGWKLGIVSP